MNGWQVPAEDGMAAVTVEADPDLETARDSISEPGTVDCTGSTRIVVPSDDIRQPEAM